jgi:outer membrane protein OmpA-like peptidoglycan-associated protein
MMEIFATLNNGNDFAVGPLAPNDDVESPPLKELIYALAEVLRKTSWRVVIEIHTSLTGSDDRNYQTARNRGSKLLARLRERGIPEAQIRLDPKGASNPLIAKPKDENEAKENRRIVIRRLDLSQ